MSSSNSTLSARALRYRNVEDQKSSGATYTPPNLAEFVASEILKIACLPKRGPIRVLDPAVGDGELLHALISLIPKKINNRLEVIGYDTDLHAIQQSSARLHHDFPEISFHIEQKDFLEHVLSLRGDLTSEPTHLEPIHLVIANPPYVRTQILGADKAQMLARHFRLSGRVDLYYPFLLGISQVLALNGVVGVITSNRFMTTKSGQSVRRELLTHFDIEHVWDMGDTKLFEAAVLPAVLLARKSTAPSQPRMGSLACSSIYETTADPTTSAPDALSALASENGSVVAIADGRRFHIKHGTLDNDGDPEGVWRIATEAADQWLTTVEAHTWGTFRNIGKIRVGVKTTADKVFIRSDWDQQPSGRPELLRPLINRYFSRRFKATAPALAKHIKEILYPHETTTRGREAVDLSLYPKAKQYLEAHRDTLESRHYVIAAGRRWYEIWVPHDPSAWASPKLVFPDISDKPTFWVDTSGGVVNGDCYWLRCEDGADPDSLWLALAVANSTFIEVFYDHRFSNKLYSGRRRFITQYVEQFPLPDPHHQASLAIIEMAKKIYNTIPSPEADSLASELDELVWNAFGLLREECSR